MLKKADHIYYGGDYNPDQWDDATIEEDMRLFEQAGINLVTLPVFSWAKLEPDEGVYDFSWLDHILDKIWQHGISVCLATPTTAQPAWLSARYKEVLPVDIAGRKRTHGMRVYFCVNSLKYRQRAAAIAEEMGKRYQNHPALAIWHVSNEYGTYCYCKNCEAKFRQWLKRRYHTLEELNKRWNTAFWGRTLTSFEEVFVPSELNDDYRFHPAIQLDYMRFMTDSTAECYENEYRILKKYTPDIPVMSNMSGYIKKLDQSVMTAHMDMVGWDNYPAPTDEPSFIAFKHEIMRGLKGGQSFMLTEQSPNQQNWQPYNKLKRPKEVRLLTYQAMAHGADTCMFFQLRQSIAGQEKFHGAVISHSGREDTRVFQECKELGAELKQLKDSFLDGRIEAKAAILFDWNNWWALELSSGPSKDMDYLKSVSQYYKAFYAHNLLVDVIGVQEDFSKYSVLVAPMLYMMKEGVAQKIKQFVAEGGTFLATTMSGLVDENDRCIFGEYPGPLKELLGIWVEETDALYKEERNQMCMEEGLDFHKTEYDCSFLCDLLHTEGAKVLAKYGSDFYAGMPCLTKNQYQRGTAYYIGTQPSEEFLLEWIEKICRQAGMVPVYQASEGVEITVRTNAQNSVVFVLNHNETQAVVDFKEEVLTDLLTGEKVSGKITLSKMDVRILQKEGKEK